MLSLTPNLHDSICMHITQYQFHLFTSSFVILDFGWDWGPAFVPAGIWRNIGLVAFDVGLVTSVTPRVSYASDLHVFTIDILICGIIPKKK